VTLESAAAVAAFTGESILSPHGSPHLHLGNGVEQLVQLHRGQGLDIFWRDSVQCPTEDDYKRMVLQSKNGMLCHRGGCGLIADP
jgi:hypothetical protein